MSWMPGARKDWILIATVLLCCGVWCKGNAIPIAAIILVFLSFAIIIGQRNMDTSANYSAPLGLNLACALLCHGDSEKCLSELKKADEFVKDDADRINLAYLRLLAIKSLKQDTAKFEPEFKTLLDRNIVIFLDFDDIEKWLASDMVDAETKAFGVALTEKLKAKKRKVK